MALLDPQAEFFAGLEHAAHHWLAFWQHDGHDSESRRHARGHALRALMWCVDWETAPDTTADLAVALHGYMMRKGQWSEWEPCLRKLLERTRPHISDERCYEVQHCLISLYFRLHQLDDAIALAHDNERIATALGDIKRQERVAIGLAETYLNVPRFDLAQAYAERGAELAIVLGDCIQEADALIDLARALLGQDKLAEAEGRLARAYNLAVEAGDAAYQCKAQLFRGRAAAARKEWQRSLEYCAEALALVQSYGDEAGRGVVLTNMGRALLELGRWDEAGETLEQALRIHQFHGNAPAEQICLQRLQGLEARRPLARAGL